MSTLTVKPALNGFVSAIDTAIKIYTPVRIECIWCYESLNEGIFHPRVASKIVGLAFLSIVSAWEEFLEQTFLRYMAGAVSGSGYKPRLNIGKCKDTTHALQLLSGTSRANEAVRFLKWNDYNWVLNASSVHFSKGEPYSSVPEKFRKRLTDAQTIRNRVAHSSSKARIQFKNMVNRCAGNRDDTPLPKGFSPGRYLIDDQAEIIFDKSWIDSKSFAFCDVFQCYSEMFTEIAKLIAPETKEIGALKANRFPFELV